MKVNCSWEVLPLTMVLVVLVSGCSGSPGSKCTKNENCDTGYLCDSDGKCVKPDIFAFTIVTETVKTAIIGADYTDDPAQSIKVAGGLSPYTWALTINQDSTTLLDWLDLDVNSGLLRNKQGMVPTQAQMTSNAQFTVTVTDSSNGGSGQTVSKQYTMVIAECVGTVANCYESNSGLCYVGTAPCTAGTLGACTLSANLSNYFYRCGPTCGPCNADTESNCVNGVCKCGTSDSCGSKNCCSDTCVNIKTDKDNCNNCGHKCLGTEPICCNGACFDADNDPNNCGSCGHTCDAGQSCCGGNCVITASDTNNCGECGKTCNVANAHGASCNASVCNYGTCNTNYGNCDNDMATNGCEENLLTSSTHCGTCDKNCTISQTEGHGCINGACGCSDDNQCPALVSKCCGSNNKCVNLNSDAANCGLCGITCDSSSCSGGTCACSTNDSCPSQYSGGNYYCGNSNNCVCPLYNNNSCPVDRYCCYDKGCCTKNCDIGISQGNSCSVSCGLSGKTWCSSGKCCTTCPDTGCL